MISIRVYGKKNSKLIYKIKSLKKIGFLYVLLESCNEDVITAKFLFDNFNIDITTIKEIIIEAQELNIIKYTSEIVDSKIILGVEFLSQIIEEIEINTLVDSFGVSRQQLKELENMSMIENKIDNELFFNNFIILTKRIDLPRMVNNFSINSQKDLIIYLQTAYIQDIFASWKSKPNAKDLEFIFKLLVVEKMDKSVVNLLIDYSIKTNTYNSFNINFASKVAATWQNKNINNVEEGIKFLSEVKEIIASKKMKSRYVAPEFDEVFVDANILPTDLEIEDIIENVYNR
ncbi:MAG: DnaD domain protein [Mycoplasmatales bacterium]